MFYAADRRLRLSFQSPFLRNAPTELVIEGGTVGSPRSWATHEVVDYEEAFKLELIEFADSIAERRAPRTTAEDGLADVELCVEIIEAMQAGGASPPPADDRVRADVETDRAVLVANAPVTYGAFERTIGLPGVPTAEDGAVGGCRGRLRRHRPWSGGLPRSRRTIAGGPRQPRAGARRWVRRAAVQRPSEPPRRLARAGRRPRPVRCRRVAPGIPSASSDARPCAHGRARRAPRSGRAATDRSPWARPPGRRSSRGLPRRSSDAARAATSRRSTRSSERPSNPPTRSRPCSTSPRSGSASTRVITSRPAAIQSQP